MDELLEDEFLENAEFNPRFELVLKDDFIKKLEHVESFEFVNEGLGFVIQSLYKYSSGMNDMTEDTDEIIYSRLFACSRILLVHEMYMTSRFFVNPVESKYFFDSYFFQLDGALTKTKKVFDLHINSKMDEDPELKERYNEADVGEEIGDIMEDLYSLSDSVYHQIYLLCCTRLTNLRACYPSIELINFVTDEMDFELDEKNDTVTKKDTRRSGKEPTNTERIKALKEFCPELWFKLSHSTKETQKKIIHLITAVNIEDSYKFSFGHRQKEMNSKIIEGVDDLISNLSKSKK
jgi:hypothetical protein